MNGSDLVFHRQFRFETLPVAKDARHRKNPITHPVPHAHVVLLEAAVDLDGLPALGMADVVDGDVVVLAPEEGHVGEVRTLTDDRAGHRLALPLSQHPVLDPHEAVLFVAMTRDNAVWRAPFMKDGSVSKVGRFCSLFGPSGPDGMTIDTAGRLFVAHASLGHVFVFAPNGECIARIKSCAGQSCTNVAIGGANRDRLYITESVTGTVLVADISGLDR